MTTDQQRTSQKLHDSRLLAMFKEAEVIIAVTDEGVQVLPRDEVPNQNSVPVIFASWLAHNAQELVRLALQAKAEFDKQQAAPKLLGPSGAPLQ